MRLAQDFGQLTSNGLWQGLKDGHVPQAKGWE
jgi:hypothetical protein